MQIFLQSRISNPMVVVNEKGERRELSPRRFTEVRGELTIVVRYYRVNGDGTNSGRLPSSVRPELVTPTGRPDVR